ncbi:MAG: 50S ribosomal protein L29 [Anaerolineae bacterium]|nr:50S ribosomal protein L29 [Anaerolineae bacterium]
MKANEIRALTVAEIGHKLDDTYQELMNLRIQVRAGQQKNTARLMLLRRDIARLQTVLREREIEEFMAKEQEG